MNSLLTYVFVTLFFGGGLPLLYPISALYFGVTYWVDKYLLTKHYRKPPSYNTRIAKGALFWFKWALLIHCVITVRMISTTEILMNDGEEIPMEEMPRKLNEGAAGAYFGVTWLVIIALLLWRYCIRYAVKRCRCCKKENKGLKSNEVHQDFYLKCSF